MWLTFTTNLLNWNDWSQKAAAVTSILYVEKVCIYPTPPPWVGSDTRSIFKWSTTGLNSDFFSYTDCLTKAKEPSLLYYLSIDGRGREEMD